VAETWVRAVRSDDGGVGDDLFLDRNYVDAAGAVGTSFITETGQHTFETIDQNLSPTWRAVTTVGQPANNSEDHPVRVILQPV
jgi:hypothetical protein